MDQFDEKIKEALHETVNGFEVPDETKERIAEKIRKAENEDILQDAGKNKR